jgi:hypothetical protein
MAMLVVYLRCNGGHYFGASPACPLDGWSMPGMPALLSALEGLQDAGLRPTIALLREHGVACAVLARTVVIEFGSEAAVFEAMEPAGYLLAGQWTPASEAGLELS